MLISGMFLTLENQALGEASEPLTWEPGCMREACLGMPGAGFEPHSPNMMPCVADMTLGFALSGFYLRQGPLVPLASSAQAEGSPDPGQRVFVKQK